MSVELSEVIQNKDKLCKTDGQSSNSHSYKLTVGHFAFWNTLLSFCLTDFDRPVPYILLTMCTDILLSQQPWFSNKKVYSWHGSAVQGMSVEDMANWSITESNLIWNPYYCCEVMCLLPLPLWPWYESFSKNPLKLCWNWINCHLQHWCLNWRSWCLKYCRKFEVLILTLFIHLFFCSHSAQKRK